MFTLLVFSTEIQITSLLGFPIDVNGWDDYHYIFTIFISDVDLSVVFDVIRYPNIR